MVWFVGAYSSTAARYDMVDMVIKCFGGMAPHYDMDNI